MGAAADSLPWLSPASYVVKANLALLHGVSSSSCVPGFRAAQCRPRPEPFHHDTREAATSIGAIG